MIQVNQAYQHYSIILHVITSKLKKIATELNDSVTMRNDLEAYDQHRFIFLIVILTYVLFC